MEFRSFLVRRDSTEKVSTNHFPAACSRSGIPYREWWKLWIFRFMLKLL